MLKYLFWSYFIKRQLRLAHRRVKPELENGKREPKNKNKKRNAFRNTVPKDSVPNEFSGVCPLEESKGSFKTTISRCSLHTTASVNQHTKKAQFALPFSTHESNTILTSDVQSFFRLSTNLHWTSEELVSLSLYRKYNSITREYGLTMSRKPLIDKYRTVQKL